MRTSTLLTVHWACFIIFTCWGSAWSQEPESAIDLPTLSSPILFEGSHEIAYRDPAVVYHDGRFYLYFTLVDRDEDGGCHWFLAMSTSSDLKNWSDPERLTPRDRDLNYCAPGNVIRYDNQWVICYQTYPTPKMQKYGDGTARIFSARSDDLKTWSEPELLRVKGDDTERKDMGRMIDPYLVEDRADPGKWWCFYKQNGVSMSWSRDLQHWTYVGHREAGENVTVLPEGDEYVMFHSPHNGIGIKRSRNLEDWGKDETLMVLGQDQWPWAKQRITAGTVIDLRNEPRVGKYLMFFHGDRDAGDQPAHGEASLGIAWSEDLKEWSWPGKD